MPFLLARADMPFNSLNGLHRAFEDLLDFLELRVDRSLGVSSYGDQAVDILAELREPFLGLVVKSGVIDHAAFERGVIDSVFGGAEAEL